MRKPIMLCALFVSVLAAACSHADTGINSRSRGHGGDDASNDGGVDDGCGTPLPDGGYAPGGDCGGAPPDAGTAPGH